jgi:hypothetical protein
MFAQLAPDRQSKMPRPALAQASPLPAYVARFFSQSEEQVLGSSFCAQPQLPSLQSQGGGVHCVAQLQMLPQRALSSELNFSSEGWLSLATVLFTEHARKTGKSRTNIGRFTNPSSGGPGCLGPL